ncbi:helix-turn-helix domain-containing protein [Mycobacterium riyadhense]|uniref:helix-turn-helix domain-containing protein n=1 Tax=Mycobacterium riyadhense TaxID=486698 RepID=UPI00194F2450|nr:helix-turn-helix domain-containing protein [Mycobacterium riyadhense]
MAITKEPQKTRKARGKRSRGIEQEDTTIDADLANQALCALNQILDEPTQSSEAVDVTIEGHAKIVRLPRGLGEILRQILASAAAGRAVAVMPDHAELTTQQAADMLNVSRPHLIKLVEEGAIEYRKVGTHRRIQAASVREYLRRMELDTKKAADELTELTEELGLY